MSTSTAALTTNEKQYWVAIAHADFMTPSHWKQLLAVFPSAEAVWHASEKDLAATGVPPYLVSELLALRKTLDPEKAVQRMEQEGIRAITLNEPTYPRLLREIADPPYVLFVEGDLPIEESVGGLGVVGTRKMSPYGQAVLPPIVAACAETGLTIVSGLALGIDGVAHETAIRHGGRTIAVIGSGIDRTTLYPWQHRPLADRIVASGGAIVSEYPIGTEPRSDHFPARNRIISGLSLGILVCEAPKKSGALITAFAALDQNREVFAIPGPIQHPNSFGPHDLVKRGAILTTEAKDILETLPITVPLHRQSTKKEKTAMDTQAPIEQTIHGILEEGILHVDDIVRRANLTTEAIMSTLVLMEMHGKIRNVGNMHYTII